MIRLPSWLRRMSLEERVAIELVSAREMRLSANESLEYYRAMADLAEVRIARLENELISLAQEHHPLLVKELP